MKIKILGAGHEVGRSAILLQDKSSVVLDFGTKIEPEPPSFPMDCKPDFAVLTHAHLDHCGGLPLLYRHGKPPAFMTDVTLELVALLLKDSMKIARKENFPIPFGKSEVKKLIHQTKITNYNEEFSLGSLHGSLYDAGHIPGSASVLVSGRKKVFYTGDIQVNETNLLNGCSLPKSADVMITESTYGHRIHPDREKEESRLVELVEEAISRDNSALLPSFSVGRAQELLLILKKYSDIIAIDGMVKTASEIISEYGARTRNPRKLAAVLEEVKFLRSEEDRDLALKKHKIIISSAGMLGGGPAVRYLRELKDNANSKIIFTGFLLENTPGKNLMETGVFRNSEESFEVKCELHRVDLSAHADKSDIFHIVRKLRPELVVCVHGDKCKEFANDMEKELGVQAVAPKNGEEIGI